LYGPYDPLQYPLLFPYGEFGWHNDILRANEILPESVIPMDMDVNVDVDVDVDVDADVDVDERVDEEEVEQHTGATQDIANLSLGLPFSLDDPLIGSSKDKGKGKEKEIELVEFDNNDEGSEPESVIYGDEDSESLENQQEISTRKRVSIREFVVYRIQIRNSNKTKSILHLSGRLF